MKDVDHGEDAPVLNQMIHQELQENEAQNFQGNHNCIICIPH